MTIPHDVYPDDDLVGSIAEVDQKAKRLQELHQWFSYFKDYCWEDGKYVANFSTDAVAKINADYWEIMCESVRTRIKPCRGDLVRADRHKIASLLELLIVHHLPFDDPDQEIKEDVNARAAFFVATNIIGNWGRVEQDDLYVSDSFDREHRTWLKELNRNSENNPIFSNAATWYMVELLFIERQQCQMPLGLAANEELSAA